MLTKLLSGISAIILGIALSYLYFITPMYAPFPMLNSILSIFPDIAYPFIKVLFFYTKSTIPFIFASLIVCFLYGKVFHKNYIFSSVLVISTFIFLNYYFGGLKIGNFLTVAIAEYAAIITIAISFIYFIKWGALSNSPNKSFKLVRSLRSLHGTPRKRGAP